MASEAALFQQLAHLSDRQLQQDYLSHPERAASLVQGFSHLEDETLALRLVKLALPIQPRMGAKLAGILPPELQAPAIQLIAELDAPLAFKYQLLGLTGSDRAIAHLCSAIKPTVEALGLKITPEASQAAILALRQIGSEAAIALAVCAALLGEGREAEALAYVLAARPKARPNAWIVTLADAILERDGKLVQAFQRAKPNMGLW